jgi:hypothetical protein
MKKNKKIKNPYRKGNQYARMMNRRLFLCIALIAVAVCAIACIMDPSAINGGVFGGVSLANMMLIGNVEDVSDRDTHGSNITYQVYLINVKQVDRTVQFPMPNTNREVGSIPMQSGQHMKYFEAHDIPTYSSTGEKGDITTSGENIFTIIMGGMRDQLLTFIEEHAGDKFIVLFKEIGTTQWFILGSVDRPMILKSFEAKNDKDGRYVTFTFSRVSIDQYCKYAGNIVTAPATIHTADATTLTISPASNEYEIPDGTAATYAINAVGGITATDKGRFITLRGSGAANAATIADGTSFILEDGATWTARAGSSITFRILDASTLVEVSGTRIQTA